MIQDGQLVSACTHPLSLLFLSCVWNDCQGAVDKLHAHLLFLGVVFRKMFMRLRLLYFRGCGHELYSGYRRTKWKIGGQSIIYRLRHLSPGYSADLFKIYEININLKG